MKSRRLTKIVGLAVVGCWFAASGSYAQKAGDIISGTVNDDLGPVSFANVVELDETNRIVANAVRTYY